MGAMRFLNPDSQLPRRASVAYEKHQKTSTFDVGYVRGKK
jgi:hypothetical protein